GELDDVIRLRDQTRDVAYMVLSADQFLPGTTVSDAEVERYYNAHRGRYMNPEQVSVDYIELSVASLAKEIHPTEQELRDLYQQEAARFTEPEQRRAEDILIRVAKDASPQQVAAARAKAEGLLQRIRAGASFEQLAKEYSQDPGSAAKGGDLGYIAKGMTDKSFQDALFSIPQVGQVVGPVHDSYGFHLIKLTGTQPGSRLSFQQARPALERQYRRQRAETLFYKESNAFTNLAYEHPDSLEPAAKALGLPIQHSGWFTRQGGGAGIAANPKVVAAAFSNAVLAQGNNSDPVQLAPDDAIVLRVREHKAATLRPLSEVSAEIRNELRMKTAQGGAEAAGQAVLQQLRKGVSVPALAAQYKATLQQANAVPRTDTKIDGAVLRTAFTLPRPAPGKPSFGGVALKSGYAVVVVSAVHGGNPATVSKQDRLQLRRALTRLYGANQFEDLLEVLRQNAKIVIHKDRL
ncbi:MAG: peptidyl-prolyl cis-trans isomerase, partial [Gammaproteobacteria bacterium]|nr:peptidyl-prolyl cis-trans isomerase [Gammaproteobacteria bacterium]